MPDATTCRRLALLLWSADPTRPELCGTPFAIAAAAAAMDAEVEIHFAARSVTLLRAATADALQPGPAGGRSVGWFIREAREAGVRFLACHASLAAWRLDAQDCDPWLDGVSGSTAFADRVLDPAWSTLVF